MKKVLKLSILAVFLGFCLLQFYRPDRTNPPFDASSSLAATTAIPGDVAAVLRRSCNDCHSYDTVYPWYSNVSPASWFLANHIRDGRDELNFSVWGTYTEVRKARKLEDICETVRSGEMPLPSYLWVHRAAALTEEEKRLLCDWATLERAKIEK